MWLHQSSPIDVALLTHIFPIPVTNYSHHESECTRKNPIFMKVNDCEILYVVIDYVYIKEKATIYGGHR